MLPIICPVIHYFLLNGSDVSDYYLNFSINYTSTCNDCRTIQIKLTVY